MIFRKAMAFTILLFLPLTPTAAWADPAATPWTGLYVGVQGGYAWSSTSWTFPFDTFFTFLNEPFRGYSTDPQGAFAGGHLGFNYQMGAIVVGLEAAFNGTMIDQTRVGAITPSAPDDRYTTSIGSFETITGRLGYAHEGWLFYADGGYATAKVSLNIVSGPPEAGVTADFKKRHDGWILGGGVDRMIFPNVVLGLEYGFVRLAPTSQSTIISRASGAQEFEVIDTGNIDLQSITARLSIKLD